MSGDKSTLRTVIDGAAGYVISSAVVSLVGFLLLPVWTACLSKEEFGVLGVLQAYVALFTPVAMLGMHASIVRERVDHSEASGEWKQYASTLFYAASFQSIIVVLVVSPLLYYVGVGTGGTIFRECLPVVLAGLAVAAPLLVLQTLLKAEEDHRCVNLIHTLGNVLALCVGVVAVVHFEMGVYGRFLGVFLGSLLGLYAFRSRQVRDAMGFCFKREMWKRAVSYGLPTIPHRLSLVILVSTDRIILEKFCSLEEVGGYSLVSSFALRFGLLITAINSAWMPRYQRLRKMGESANSTIHGYNLGWIVAVGSVFILASLIGLPLFNLMSYGEYYDVCSLIVPIMAGCLLVGLNHLATAPIFYEKKMRLLPVISGTAAIFNIVANFIFIPKYGADGAAWSTLASYTIMLIMGVLLGQRAAVVKFPWMRAFVIVFLMLTAVVVLAVMGYSAGKLSALNYSLLAVLTVVIFILTYWGLFYKDFKPYLDRLMCFKSAGFAVVQIFKK